MAQVPIIRLISGKARAMNATLLTRANPDSLPALSVANRIRLRVLQSYQRNQKVADGFGRESFIFSRHVLKASGGNFNVIMFLRESHAENLLSFNRGRLVIGIHFYDKIIPVALSFKNFQSLSRIGRRNNSVRNFAAQEISSSLVAFVR